MLKVYSKSLDLIMKSVELARKKKFTEAAKVMAEAWDQDDYQQTMEALDAGQQKLFDPGVDDQDQEFLDDQQSLSKALARLSRNTKAVVAAEDSDSGSDAGSASDQEEDAGAGEFSNSGSDATSVKVEHASGSDSSGSEQEQDASPSLSRLQRRRQLRAQANLKSRR